MRTLLWILICALLVLPASLAKENFLTSDGLLTLGGAGADWGGEDRVLGLLDLNLELRSKNRDVVHFYIGAENLFGYGAMRDDLDQQHGALDLFPYLGMDLALPRQSPISIVLKPKLGYGYSLVPGYLQHDTEENFHTYRWGLAGALALNHLTVARSVLLEAEYSRYAQHYAYHFLTARLFYVPYDTYEASMGAGVCLVFHHIRNKKFSLTGGGIGLTF